MEFRMINKPVIKVIGFELKTSTQDGRNQRDIPAFWEKYLSEKLYTRFPMSEPAADTIVELGICANANLETGEMSYIIGVETPSFDDVPEGLTCLTIPESTYAVFTTPKAAPAEFVSSIQSTWQAIFSEWFPHSGYEHAGTPEFEWYDERCHQDKHELLQMDIYIPVKPKQA